MTSHLFQKTATITNSLQGPTGIHIYRVGRNLEFIGHRLSGLALQDMFFKACPRQNGHFASSQFHRAAEQDLTVFINRLVERVDTEMEAGVRRQGSRFPTPEPVDRRIANDSFQ